MSGQTRGHEDAGMVWWPYQRYELVSHLSRQQIKDKFEQADEDAVYTATYTGKRIHIKESSNFKFGADSRSFKPEADLTETSATDTFKYDLIIKPQIGSILLLLLIIVLIMAGITFSKRNDLLMHHYKDTAIGCICVLLMGYALPIVTFNADLAKLKLFIDDLLEVEP